MVCGTLFSWGIADRRSYGNGICSEPSWYFSHDALQGQDSSSIQIHWLQHSLLSSFILICPSHCFPSALKPSPAPGGDSVFFSYWSRVRIKDLLGPQTQQSAGLQCPRALSRLQPGIFFSTACKSGLDSGSLRERCLITFPCDFKPREHKRGQVLCLCLSA